MLVAAAPLRAQCPDGSPPPCGPVVPRQPYVQVLAFEASQGDTASAYLAQALTDDLRAALASTGSVIVLAGGTARRGVAYLVTGRVSRTGDITRITANMVQPATGRVAWATALNRPRRDLPRTADTIAVAVLEALGIRAEPLRTAGHPDPQLYDLTSRGRYQMGRRTAESMTRAVALFREAIAYDSSSAVGWAWLARTLIFARRWDVAISGLSADSLMVLGVNAAERAAELDPSNPTVWLTRSQVASGVQPTSRAGAIAALRRAVALDPRLAEAWQSLGLAYDEVGDTGQARATFERAVALAPDDGQYLTWLGLHTFWGRDYQRAARWADSAIAMDPSLPMAYALAAQVAFWSGRTGDAEARVTALAQLSRGTRDILGSAIAVEVPLARGDSAAARAAQQAAIARAGPTPPIHSAIAIGEGYLVLGDTARAIAALARFPVLGDLHYQLHLRSEPGLDGLRGRLEFERLLVPLPRVSP